MQINNANSYTPQSNVSVPVDNQNQLAEQRDRFRVSPSQESTEQAKQSNAKAAQQAPEQSQQLSQKSSQVERFDVDEKALALVEQAQFENRQAQSNQNQNSNQNVPQAPAQSLSTQSGNAGNSQGKQTASYDSPSQQNQTAIAAYSSVDNIAQRENIQQVFGVDLLA